MSNDPHNPAFDPEQTQMISIIPDAEDELIESPSPTESPESNASNQSAEPRKDDAWRSLQARLDSVQAAIDSDLGGYD